MKLHCIYFSAKVFFCSSIIINCTNNNEVVTEYVLDSFFSKIKVNSNDTITRINVCEIIEAKWDSMLVVKPYANVAEQEVLRNLENYYSISTKIKDIRYTDSYNYLILVKKNKAVGVSKVPNTPVYIGSMPSIDVRSPSVAILNKKDCHKLFMRKNGYVFISKN